MSVTSLTVNSGYVAMKIRIDPGRISSSGPPGQPTLHIPFQFDLIFPFQQADRAFEPRELLCQVSPFDQQYFATSRMARLDGLVSAERKESKDSYGNLEIPLDRERVAFLERESKGKDISLRLDAQVLANELVRLGQTKDPHTSRVWGLAGRHVLREQIRVIIPRQAWIERILPQTGYGKIHVIELPAVAVESCAGIKKSFDALSEAVELQRKGHWNDAVARCRIALEPFFKTIPKVEKDGTKRDVPVLEPSWETKLGKASYQWLNECFVGLKRPTNQPHHSTGYLFDQLEVQLLITITTALVAYAADTASRLQKENPEP